MNVTTPLTDKELDVYGWSLTGMTSQTRNPYGVAQYVRADDAERAITELRSEITRLKSYRAIDDEAAVDLITETRNRALKAEAERDSQQRVCMTVMAERDAHHTAAACLRNDIKEMQRNMMSLEAERDSQQHVCMTVMAERDALRQDAERYRLLVEMSPDTLTTLAVDAGYRYQVPHDILRSDNREAILDAALAAKAGA